MTQKNFVMLELPSGSPSNGGSGISESHYGERLTRIEAKMEQAAMMEDILNLKIWVLPSVVIGMLSAVGINFGIIKFLS